jgi:hypothetical protein
MSLFAVSLSPEQCSIVVLAAISMAAIVGLLFRKDLWKVAQRRKLEKLAALLSQYGMPGLADICQCVADGDLAGAVKEMHYLHKQLEKEDTARLLLGGIAKKQLPALLADQGERIALLKSIADWAAAHPDDLKTAGFTVADIK